MRKKFYGCVHVFSETFVFMAPGFVGFIKGFAPRFTVSLKAEVAAFTQRAITFTPSPCFARCWFIGCGRVLVLTVFICSRS